jgi:hypothetical protein
MSILLSDTISLMLGGVHGSHVASISLFETQERGIDNDCIMGSWLNKARLTGPGRCSRPRGKQINQSLQALTSDAHKDVGNELDFKPALQWFGWPSWANSDIVKFRVNEPIRLVPRFSKLLF